MNIFLKNSKQEIGYLRLIKQNGNNNIIIINYIACMILDKQIREDRWRRARALLARTRSCGKWGRD